MNIFIWQDTKSYSYHVIHVENLIFMSYVRSIVEKVGVSV